MDFKVMNKLFVYGTLKRQYSRNSILGAASFIKETQTLPLYTMIDLGAFPGILDSGRSVIYGEVYEVDNSVLEMCDLIDNSPDVEHLANLYQYVEGSDGKLTRPLGEFPIL